MLSGSSFSAVLRAHAGPSTMRSFTSSSKRAATPVTHYDALSLPKNATRQQIKARFYELSKKYHPDSATGDTAKFHKINDAYATLGNDGSRRQYDQSISRPAQSSSSGGFGGYGYQGPYTRPGPAGPHRAWGRAPPRRPPSDPSQAQYNPFGRRSPFGGMGGGPDLGGTGAPGGGGPGRGGYARVAPDPFGRMRSAQGRRTPPGMPPRSNVDDEFQGESGVWRFIIGTGLVLAVIGFGGGLTASADEGEWDGRKGQGEGEGMGDLDATRHTV